jgi:hypothetical protein
MHVRGFSLLHKSSSPHQDGPWPGLFTTDDTDITDIQCWKLLMIDSMLFHGAQTARIAVSELS